MLSAKNISVGIPTFRSSRYLRDALANVVPDPRVDDIVVSDDASDDFAALRRIVRASHHPESFTAENRGKWRRIETRLKRLMERVLTPSRGTGRITLRRNDRNLSALKNKWVTVQACRNEWVILLDSDNMLSKTYVDTLFSLPEWRMDTLYCPDFGVSLDYRCYAGQSFGLPEAMDRADDDHFLMLLNTGNYFVPRERYIQTISRDLPDDCRPGADVAIFSLWWMQQGGRIEVVSGLEYFHRLRGDGFYSEHSAAARADVTFVRETLLKAKAMAARRP